MKTESALYPTQQLTIDYAGGKFYSWFYSDGKKYKGKEGLLKDVLTWAKKQDFNEVVMTDEAKSLADKLVLNNHKKLIKSSVKLSKILACLKDKERAKVLKIIAESNPSQYKTPYKDTPEEQKEPKKFAPEEMLAAIRQDIIAEYDAVNLYEAHKHASQDAKFNKIIQHIIEEEKEHAAELQAYLNEIDKTQKSTMIDNKVLGNMKLSNILAKLTKTEKRELIKAMMDDMGYPFLDTKGKCFKCGAPIPETAWYRFEKINDTVYQVPYCDKCDETESMKQSQQKVKGETDAVVAVTPVSIKDIDFSKAKILKTIGIKKFEESKDGTLLAYSKKTMWSKHTLTDLVKEPNFVGMFLKDSYLVLEFRNII